MALVRRLEKLVLERDTKHSEVSATYSIVETPEGRMLQIDTYGSLGRQFPGKKSQSIRLTPEAINELRNLLDRIGR